MSIPIKPPGGPPAGVPIDGPAGGKGAIEGTKGSFRDSLKAGDTSETQGVSGTQAGQALSGQALSGQDMAQQLADAMKSGQITGPEAVQQVVERSLGPAMGNLSEQGRAQLTQLIEHAMENDPNLQALVQQIGSVNAKDSE